MSAPVRPLRLPGATALEALRQRAQDALDGWAREWVSGGDPRHAATVRLHAADTGRPGHDGRHELVRSEHGGLWLRCGADDRAAFARAVLGSGPDPLDDWSRRALDAAQDACRRALGGALLGTADLHIAPAEEVPAALFAFGAGSVQVSCAGFGLHAIADAGVWHAMPPPDRAVGSGLSGLVPLDRAARGAAARISVPLGQVDIEIGRLLDLRRGDVLRLPQRLDRRFAVLCDGRPLAHAVLGEFRGRRGVQVFATDR